MESFYLSCFPSKLTTMQFLTPILSKLNTVAFCLALLMSFARTIPEFLMICAMCVVFPPGAEHISRIFSFLWGSRAITGSNELALWSIYCPDKYSGVAPIGTFDSNIFSPTFVHGASGSRLTPLCTKLWKRSLLLVFRVLILMVSGLYYSFASRNCTHSVGLNSWRNRSIKSVL